jgi:hypothetical protein
VPLKTCFYHKCCLILTIYFHVSLLCRSPAYLVDNKYSQMVQQKKEPVRSHKRYVKLNVMFTLVTKLMLMLVTDVFYNHGYYHVYNEHILGTKPFDANHIFTYCILILLWLCRAYVSIEDSEDVAMPHSSSPVVGGLQGVDYDDDDDCFVPDHPPRAKTNGRGRKGRGTAVVATGNKPNGGMPRGHTIDEDEDPVPSGDEEELANTTGKRKRTSKPAAVKPTARRHTKAKPSSKTAARPTTPLRRDPSSSPDDDDTVYQKTTVTVDEGKIKVDFGENKLDLRVIKRLVQ